MTKLEIFYEQYKTQLDLEWKWFAQQYNPEDVTAQMFWDFVEQAKERIENNKYYYYDEDGCE